MHMYTFEIEKYLNHYVNNAKIISVRDFRYYSKAGATEKKKGKNFDLFFNQEGLLKEVVHLEYAINKSTIYYKNKQIHKIIKSKWSNNEIISEIDTGFDEQNRLIYEAEKTDFNNDNSLYVQELFYNYDGNIRTTDMYCEYDEEHYIITDVLDENGNTIESKAVEEGGELKYWLKDLFDENNKYIRTMDLNEDGSEVIQNDNTDKETVVEDIYEEKFTYNNRNDWIVKEIYKNNILKESTERNITYF